jgi:hypothetical protein
MESPVKIFNFLLAIELHVSVVLSELQSGEMSLRTAAVEETKRAGRRNIKNRKTGRRRRTRRKGR